MIYLLLQASVFSACFFIFSEPRNIVSKHIIRDKRTIHRIHIQICRQLVSFFIQSLRDFLPCCDKFHKYIVFFAIILWRELEIYKRFPISDFLDRFVKHCTRIGNFVTGHIVSKPYSSMLNLMVPAVFQPLL